MPSGSLKWELEVLAILEDVCVKSFNPLIGGNEKFDP